MARQGRAFSEHLESYLSSLSKRERAEYDRKAAGFRALSDEITAARERGDGSLSKALAVHVFGASKVELEEMGLAEAPDLQI